MAFGVRKFLREIPAKTLRAYFESKNAAVPPESWKRKQQKLVAELAEYLISGADKFGARILAEMVRVDPMASERGRNALLNAAAHDGQFVAQFRALANDHERALWVLMTHDDIFRDGEGLHFFDYYSESSRGRHCRTMPNRTVSRDPADRMAFEAELCRFHRRHDQSGVSCEVELADRHRDKNIQLAVYVQGLPNNVMEFVSGRHIRRLSNPSLESAVVYDPSNGDTSTVTKGGKAVHEALRDAFARNLLKIEPNFDVIERRSFLLDSLRFPQALAPDAALGVKAVRVRKLKLAPPAMNAGLMTIEAPAGMPETSVYDLGDGWFSERAGVYRKFIVVHATISMHFNVPPGGKRAKTLNIELTRPNSSNLKDLPEADRKIAESHIEKWKLLEPL